MRECSIEGCGRDVFSTSLCSAHWKRFKRTGDPERGGPIRDRKSTKYTNLEWLRDHSSHDGDDCLIWPFGRFANGYGQVCINKVNKVASREMCVAAHGEPPTPKHEAAHSCGNGHLGCVNPKHLRWATKTENETDKQIHKRLRGHEAVTRCAA